LGRVLAVLDDSVRGADPATVDHAKVLRLSRAYRAVALEALAMLGRAPTA
jgi:hypothetical protein